MTMPVMQQSATPTPPPPQQTQPPPQPTSQAPAAPQAPVTIGNMTPAQRDALRKAIRDAAQNARSAGEIARIAGEAAREAAQAGTPVISVPPGGLLDNPVMMRDMVENIANALFITIAVIALGIPLLRILGRRVSPAQAPAQIPQQMTEQLQRIEHSVDAMAIEIERISEAQRFLTRLQTGKEAAALPRAESAGR